MHRCFVFLIVGFALSLHYVLAQDSVDPYLQNQRRKAAAITIRKEGVSLKQAELLADVYFFSEVSGCGGPDLPVKRGRDWIVPVHVGYAGALDGALRIDGSTGAVSYKGHPTLLPTDFAKPLRY